MVMVVQGGGLESEAGVVIAIHRKLSRLLEASQKAKQLGVDKNRVDDRSWPLFPPLGLRVAHDP